MAKHDDLIALAERVASARGMDNSLDVQCEVALFEPDDEWRSIRANHAGTKTICTAHDGKDHAFWARDFTISAERRAKTAVSLRALAMIEQEKSE